MKANKKIRRIDLEKLTNNTKAEAKQNLGSTFSGFAAVW